MEAPDMSGLPFVFFAIFVIGGIVGIGLWELICWIISHLEILWI